MATLIPQQICSDEGTSIAVQMKAISDKLVNQVMRATCCMSHAA